MTDSLVKEIDALLPQTQCELCEYKGCLPYAEAIANNSEALDRCLPGGVRVLKNLGALLDQEVTALIPQMKEKKKPLLRAVIREDECIGCVKCYKACPVDAIIGSSKKMHTVLVDACNGCELCVAPCPVDCIDMLEMPEQSEAQELALAAQSQQRFQHHTRRVALSNKQQREKHIKAKEVLIKGSIDERKAAIASALLRVNNAKKK